MNTLDMYTWIVYNMKRIPGRRFFNDHSSYGESVSKLRGKTSRQSPTRRRGDDLPFFRRVANGKKIRARSASPSIRGSILLRGVARQSAGELWA